MLNAPNECAESFLKLIVGCSMTSEECRSTRGVFVFCQRGLWLVLGLLIVGCGTNQGMEGAGVVLPIPADWSIAPASSQLVPGETIGAWSGPEGSALALYRTLPIPHPDAADLAKELAYRMTNFPGVEVVRNEVREVAGKSATWVEVTGPGDGRSLAASGVNVPKNSSGSPLLATHRISLAFPRSADTLWFVWHYPQTADQSMKPRIEGMLKSLQVTDRSTANSTY
jgi:hypothetical protein